MKTNYTIPEIQITMTYLEPLFDIVRIVDSDKLIVLSITPEGRLQPTEHHCYEVWNRSERCENCTSQQACLANGQINKYECVENNVFYVVSKSITLVEPSGQKRLVALEIVSHINDHFAVEEISSGNKILNTIQETNRKIYEDPLTHVFNRRYLDDRVFFYDGHQNMNARDVAFILSDIRDFKKINDTYGHLAGDEVLKQYAAAIKKMIRRRDTILRYGGDEFLIILSECPESTLPNKIASFAQAVAHIKIQKVNPVYVDFGYAFSHNPVISNESLHQIIDRADAMMYQNKRGPIPEASVSDKNQ